MNGYRIRQHVSLFFSCLFLSIFSSSYSRNLFLHILVYIYFVLWHRFLYLFWLFEALGTDIHNLDECRLHEPAVFAVYPLLVKWVHITPSSLQRYEEDRRFGLQCKNSKNSRLHMALTGYSEIKYQSAIK